MAENPPPEHDPVRARLNRQADKATQQLESPDEATQTDTAALCQTLYDELKEHIHTLTEETAFKRSEAEVWTLQKYTDEHHNRLTYEAIALVLSTENSPFQAATERGTKLTRADVEELYNRAEEKQKQALRFVGATTFPNREERLQSPKITWLDRHTVTRLKNTAGPEDVTLDDIVTRLLDEKETWLPLEEFTRRYLDERGRDNVIQIELSEQSLEGGFLTLTVHCPPADDVPAVVDEADAITIDGRRYDFSVDEVATGARSFRCLTVYGQQATAYVQRISADPDVTVAEGVETIRERVQDLAERDDIPGPGRPIK